MASKTTSYRGRALSQPFVALMWLIRKNPEPGNIAVYRYCSQQVSGSECSASYISASLCYCICFHMNDMVRVSD